MAALETPSPAVEDYAKAIYSLSRQTGEAVSTSALAERLDVSAASASAMVKRMATMRLVKHERYRGVHLTKAGERIALEVIRHHRLIELYLAEALGMPWDRVHAEAEVLEHAISPELLELMDAKLGHPTRDPHGDPIPSRDGKVEERETFSLHSLRPGTTATFTRVSDAKPEVLQYLAEKGIAPGMRLEVLDAEPFEGPLVVRFGSEVHHLAAGLTRMMRVERDG